MKIAIIDYGSGNIFSVAKAVAAVGGDVTVTNNPADLYSSSHIILPGQGAFADCMQGLEQIPGMIDSLKENILHKAKPFLGICVGMQLLAQSGNEFGDYKGLGIIPGIVEKIKTDLPLPHMGWNNVIFLQDHPILNDINDNSDFYFLHSYYFLAEDQNNLVAKSNYDIDIPAIIARDNIVGIQFHPEKSHDIGLQIFKNFLQKL